MTSSEWVDFYLSKPELNRPIYKPLQVILVPLPQVQKWKRLVAPHLLPAIVRCHGRETLDTVFDALADGRYQLWVVWTDRVLSAAVTQLVKYPTGKVFVTVLFLGGEDLRSFLQPMAEALGEFALLQGATGIELQGRPGWLKALATYGVRPVGTQLLEVDLLERQRNERHQPDSQSDSQLV